MKDVKVPKWILWIIVAVALAGVGVGLYYTYYANEEREGRRMRYEYGE